MDLLAIIQSKPVLIGLHLGFAIIGIDAFLWLFGKLKGDGGSRKSMIITAAVGTIAFIGSWIAGGYYYVVYYGTLVKPIIKSGLAPSAHAIIMEAKEHIFILILPVAITAVLSALASDDIRAKLNAPKETTKLIGLVAGLGLAIGAMGFIISAAARWGA